MKNIWINEENNEWIHKYEWKIKWMNECMNLWMNVLTDKWIGEWKKA